MNNESTQDSEQHKREADEQHRGESAARESVEPESASDQEAAGSGDGGAEHEQELTLEQALERLTEAEQTLAKQQDDALRARAEMQNLRRRAEQDVEKAHKFGQERLVGELLTVIDNLERALDAVPDRSDESVKALYEGVELTLKSFLDALGKFNIEQLNPEGEPFDPQLHEAMTVQENTEVEPGTVLMVMQKGYTLHGRVIRPARVVVSKAASPGADEKA